MFTRVLITALITVALLPAQQAAPRAQAELIFRDKKKVTVDYGRPTRAKRPVFGNVVRYGRIWSPGAGQATLFSTDTPLQIDEVTVPPGHYSLYVLPTDTDWILIISQKNGQPGLPYPKGYDFARVKMKKHELTIPVEQLTFSFDYHGPTGGAMKLMWDRTEAWVDFKEKENVPADEGDAS